MRKDDRLFEALVLEGAQAGLSWAIVLGKRETYREAFEGFDPERVARFKPRKIESLLKNPGVVRHRGKLESAVGNARALLEVAEEFGSFAAYVWSAVGGAPVQNRWRRLGDLPSETAESKALSKDMKKRGFRFVGPTTVYAFMEAVGMVNDHTTDCFRHAEVAERAERWRPI